MRHFIFYVWFLCFLVPVFCGGTHSAYAQEEEKRYASLSHRNYDRSAAKIIEKAKSWTDDIPNINITSFRRQYTETPYYDPYSEDLLKLIDDLAEKMLEAEDKPETLKRLQNFYYELMSTQLANFTIISRVWQLAKQHPMFGNYEFWNALRSVIFQNILKSGDGKTAFGAYDVITLDEETYLLKYLGYEVKSTLPGYKEGLFYYNVHSVIDQKTNLPYEIYVNVTIPYNYLEEQKEKEGKDLSDIPLF